MANAVYIGLCRIRSDLGGMPVFSVSLNVVSQSSGVSKSSVTRYLKILKKAEVIDFESGVSKNGNCENTYKLIF